MKKILLPLTAVAAFAVIAAANIKIAAALAIMIVFSPVSLQPFPDLWSFRIGWKSDAGKKDWKKTKKEKKELPKSAAKCRRNIWSDFFLPC